MVDVADRSWNFSVPSEGGELTLQLLNFTPETHRPVVPDLFDVGYFLAHGAIYWAVRNDSGNLTPVTSPVVGAGGFAFRYVYPRGYTIAWYLSAEDDLPYYLYDSNNRGWNNSDVRMMQQPVLVNALPATAFWDIEYNSSSINSSSYTNGTIKNIATGNYIAGPVAKMATQDAWHRGDKACGNSFLTGLRVDAAGNQYYSCFEWEGWSDPSCGQSSKLSNCINYPSSTGTSDGVLITCSASISDGYPLGDHALTHITNINFPARGDQVQDANYNYGCCTVCLRGLPPYVAVLSDYNGNSDHKEWKTLSRHSAKNRDNIYWEYSCHDYGILQGVQWGKESGYAYCLRAVFYGPDVSSKQLTARNLPADPIQDMYRVWSFRFHVPCIGAACTEVTCTCDTPLAGIRGGKNCMTCSNGTTHCCGDGLTCGTTEVFDFADVNSQACTADVLCTCDTPLATGNRGGKNCMTCSDGTTPCCGDDLTCGTTKVFDFADVNSQACTADVLCTCDTPRAGNRLGMNCMKCSDFTTPCCGDGLTCGTTEVFDFADVNSQACTADVLCTCDTPLAGNRGGKNCMTCSDGTTPCCGDALTCRTTKIFDFADVNSQACTADVLCTCDAPLAGIRKGKNCMTCSDGTNPCCGDGLTCGTTKVFDYADVESAACVAVSHEDSPEIFDDFVALGSCEATLTIESKSNQQLVPNATDLLLDVWQKEYLNTAQRAMYQYVQQYQVVTDSRDGTLTLFACQQPASGIRSLCAQGAPVLPEDLAGLYSNAALLMIEKKCPVLLNTSLFLYPSVATPVELTGSSFAAFMSLLSSSPYKTVPFANATGWPFYFNDTRGHRAENVGYLSIPENGDAFWGVVCPKGSVVSSQEDTFPHCLDIDAASSQEILTSYSGSATCPDGYAVSGWYNLPAIKVKKSNGSAGGPQNWTALQLFCRRTSRIDICSEPAKPHCGSGHVVNAVSYDANKFNLGCCQLMKSMGTWLMPLGRAAKPYLAFEGYYCPVQMGSAGAAHYKKTAILEIGQPGNSSDLNYSLVWDKFSGDWLLHNLTDLQYRLHSAALSPVQMSTSGPFSATQITPLLSESTAKAESPIPSREPTYPELKKFSAEQPTYAEYCQYLENPRFYDGELDESNPCYHTFNAEMVQGLEATKGITEESFWSCSGRSKVRSHMLSNAQYLTDKDADELSTEQEKSAVKEARLEEAAAVAGSIPWGSMSDALIYGVIGRQTEIKVTKKTRHNDHDYYHVKEYVYESEEFGKGPHEWSTRLDWVGAQFEDGISAGSAAKSRSTAENTLEKDDSGSRESASLPQTDEELAEKITNETLPEFETGQTIYEYKQALANATWKDCMPLQYGLSKVMCDLYCLRDSVQAGTSTILKSLEGLQTNLMYNLQALLDYQTQYILWALGTVLTSAPTAEDVDIVEKRSDVPEASTLLSELEQIDFDQIKATVPRLSRDILQWHQAAGQDLHKRLASLTMNVSKESWPHRVKAARGMLHHFQASFHRRLQMGAREPPIVDKIRLLREGTAQHHKLVNK
ncbi:NEK5, partial [Symbiodinium sp. CCMP2592]